SLARVRGDGIRMAEPANRRGDDAAVAERQVEDTAGEQTAILERLHRAKVAEHLAPSDGVARLTSKERKHRSISSIKSWVTVQVGAVGRRLLVRGAGRQSAGPHALLSGIVLVHFSCKWTTPMQPNATSLPNSIDTNPVSMSAMINTLSSYK